MCSWFCKEIVEVMVQKDVAYGLFLLIREMVAECAEMELAWEEYIKCKNRGLSVIGEILEISIMKRLFIGLRMTPRSSGNS